MTARSGLIIAQIFTACERDYAVKSKNSTAPLIVGRNVGPLRTFIQSAISGGGLLGGLALGSWMVFSTGLVQRGQVLVISLHPIFVFAVSIAVVFGLAWLGVIIGLTLARKID